MKFKELISFGLALAITAGMAVTGTVASADTTTINQTTTSGTLTITLVIKGAPAATDFDVTLPTSLTYNGQAKTATATVKSGVTGMGAVTVEYYKGDTKVDSAVDAGEYTVKLNVAAGEGYDAGTVESNDWKFTIVSADPTAPTGLTATVGQTLANVSLPDGWSWVDAGTTSVGEVGNNTFSANYTDTTGNYNNKNNVELTVTVKAKPAETYSVTVVGGTSDKATAEAGATVTITATIPDGKEFVNWTTSDVEGLNGSTAATTTFTMPAKAVTVTANFKDKSSGGGQGGGGYTPVIPSYTPTTTTTTTNTGKLDNTTDEKKNDNGASLESSNDELSKAVLTDADRAAMAKGENIQVYLEVEEKKPTKAEQQKAEEALAKIDGDAEIAMYMDMNLFKKVGSKAPVQIHEVNGKVEVGFKVPEKFINSDPDTQRTFYIGHIKDDGTVEIIKCEFDPETGIATFYTDSFSCYFLIFEDAPAAADTSVEETDDDEDTDTDTGDDFDELTDDSDDDDDEEDTDGTISDDDSDDADDDHSVDNAVDDGNPHTGVSAGFGLLAVCAVTAGAALAVKKRKNK